MSSPLMNHRTIWMITMRKQTPHWVHATFPHRPIKCRVSLRYPARRYQTRLQELRRARLPLNRTPQLQKRNRLSLKYGDYCKNGVHWRNPLWMKPVRLRATSATSHRRYLKRHHRLPHRRQARPHMPPSCRLRAPLPSMIRRQPRKQRKQRECDSNCLQKERLPSPNHQKSH